MIVRFERNGKVKFGWQIEDRIRVIEGDVYKRGEQRMAIMAGLEVPLNEVKILSPCTPTKIVGIGLNYRDHAEEMGLPIPKEPMMFLKPSTSVIGPGEPIICPDWTTNIHYEAELAVVIKKEAKNVAAEEAEEYILGYTCAIDVTARDMQHKDGQWTRSKSFDTFCPLGPGILPKLDSSNLQISLSCNGEIRQQSSTKQLIFPVPRLVEEVSKVMTLKPGDVILTGTPAGVGEIKPGDEVMVAIEGIGSLRCPVV